MTGMDCDVINERSSFSDQIHVDGRMESLKYMVRSLMTEIESLTEAKEVDLNVGIDMAAQVRQYEVNLILSALRITGGNQRKAARILGLSHTTLNSKIKRYKIRF